MAAFSLINCVPTAVLQVGSCAEQAKGAWFDPRNEAGLSNAVTSLPQPRLCLEHIRIFGDKLLPQFTHHPLNVLRLVMIAVARLVTKLTQAENAQMRIAGMRNEGGLGRLVNDALRRNVKLIAGD